jgi:hypothetical protein
VLADHFTDQAIGQLDAEVHKPQEWLISLIDFIAEALPGWRDDPKRPKKTAEDALTSQLCAFLNNATHSSRWDFLQFRREEPDEVSGGRSIDLVAAPKGVVIWVEGREYSMYNALIPIECKRLPTPTGSKRDQREYLYSQFSTTGGVQRFKAGHHGADHTRGLIIGYLQASNISGWFTQINAWVQALASGAVAGWSMSDIFTLITHDNVKKLGRLESSHSRSSALAPIALAHLWIEM